jgi:hypothetical protein
MELVLTITSSILTVITAGFGILERMKPDGKLSISTIVSLTVLLLTLLTSITNNIVSSLSAREDHQSFIEKVDSLNANSRKLDSILKMNSSPGAPRSDSAQ